MSSSSCMHKIFFDFDLVSGIIYNVNGLHTSFNEFIWKVLPPNGIYVKHLMTYQLCQFVFFVLFFSTMSDKHPNRKLGELPRKKRFQYSPDALRAALDAVAALHLPRSEWEYRIRRSIWNGKTDVNVSFHLFTSDFFDLFS